MTKTTPEEFDFADWFADANLPEQSADIFTNAALLGEMADLQRRIDVEVRVQDAEKTAASPTKDSLEDQWVNLAKQFEASKITVYVRALSGTERKYIREAHDQAMNDGTEENSGFIFRVLAMSIVGMKKSGGERKTVDLSVEQVEQLYKKIGDAQLGAIHDAQLTATNGIPTLDADFLRKLSGPAAGPES
ncbi:hypothetical protein ASF21_12895 [Arthrobacter sp. Leaf234]|uniref:hypothetical protein n=1 Tax=Arthrobacter sp. Leaf234 TaxID=1736303 RepID=UPI0006FB0CED|nr:hypothetical protein [Arthrobacter sp. Leaf234]KQN99699.1 hypothetical protein ASF21_12895 [Arthrobacter sp. Leaf234]